MLSRLKKGKQVIKIANEGRTISEIAFTANLKEFDKSIRRKNGDCKGSC